ncbi:MAG: hypothetical protein ACKVW3_09805 [Phycisphaerales bacterium]
MRRATAIAALCVLAMPSAICRAQEAFEYSWEVKDVAGTGPTNANGIIEPGEDAQIFFNVSFRPGVGGTAVWDTLGGMGQLGIVGGLGWTSGNIIADQNMNTGDWIGIGYRSGFNLGVSAVIQPPQNHLLSWGFGQFLLPGETPNPLNDTWFFWAKWRPDDYTPREMRFHYERTTGQTDARVILDIGVGGMPEYVPDIWSFNNPATSFVVVPSPHHTPAIAAAFFLSRRRHRNGK